MFCDHTQEVKTTKIGFVVVEEDFRARFEKHPRGDKIDKIR
jgi:hypothetical protein